MEVLLVNIPNDYSFKKEYLDKNSSDIETIIFGPSHTFNSLIPEHLEGHAFNVAIDSQPLEYDYKIFNKYKNDFNNLETIILAISYPTLWYEIEDSRRAFSLKLNYKKYYDLDSSLNTYYPHHLEVFNRPLAINYGLINQYYIKNKQVKKSNKYGWGNSNKIQRDFKASGILRARMQTINNINSESAENTKKESLQMINSILDWGKDNNVKVLLLTTPTHQEYRKRLSEEQLRKVISTSKTLAEQHQNCYYINMLADERFKDEDFRDADHLSIKGAEKFSKIINQELKIIKED